jgi:acyl-CoA reductase-like NAD-dependent aldehyde dehydrogenase
LFVCSYCYLIHLIQIFIFYFSILILLKTNSKGVDKVIFVGSPGVGAIVAKTAAETLTPVVLELGGKDPFVVCEDADIHSIVQTACRGVWQNMGQNCAGPERFFVYEKVFEEFCDGVTSVVRNMKIGSSLGKILF